MSVNQFSHSVTSYSLPPQGLQHARLPFPLPTSRAYSSSCPSHEWCHSTISSFVIPFSSCLQSFPASRSFPMSHLSASGGQSTEVSASASALPMNIQNWFHLGWTGWISLREGFSRVFSNTTVQKRQFFSTQPFFIVQLSHPYMTTGKTIALTRWTFVGKVIVSTFYFLICCLSDCYVLYFFNINMCLSFPITISSLNNKYV